MKIKISELFYSIQGEGEFVGVPSIFLRTFGCNFTCSGFGMSRGEMSTERMDVNPLEFKKYEELPLVHTGCDSYASWDVRFKHLSSMMDVKDIADKMYQMLPNNSFAQGTAGAHLIITGGEPLLGWQRSYPALLDLLPDLTNLTFETNGTQELSQTLIDYFNNIRPGIHVTFSVSAKLSGASGEDQAEALQPDIVSGYQKIKNSNVYLKFVCAVPEDADEADFYVENYQRAGLVCPVYLMPAGGTGKLYFLNAKEVALLAMKKGYRYSPRIQVDIFKNAWGT